MANEKGNALAFPFVMWGKYTSLQNQNIFLFKFAKIIIGDQRWLLPPKNLCHAL
jgi:hypothetical protein